jgi:DNA-binding NarL/FixJ family response regulator
LSVSRTLSAAGVLIVAESASVRATLRASLDDHPRFNALELEDGAAAIAAALAGAFDLCLVALSEPERRLATVAAIAATAPRTRLVVYAPALAQSELLATLRAGAVAYLPESELGSLGALLERVLAGEAYLPGDCLAGVLEELRSASRRALRRAGGRAPLTPREWDVLELLADDLSTAEIALRLEIREVTVRSHIAATLRKLGAPSRHAALRMYRSDARGLPRVA